MCHFCVSCWNWFALCMPLKNSHWVLKQPMWGFWIFCSHSDCSTYFANIKIHYRLKIAVLVRIITGHLLVRFILFINAYSIVILCSKVWNFEFLIRDWQIFICYCLHRIYNLLLIYMFLIYGWCLRFTSLNILSNAKQVRVKH